MVAAVLTLIFALLKGRRPEGRQVPQHVWFLIPWVVVVFLSDVVNGHMADAWVQGSKYLRMLAVFVLFWLVIDSTAKLRGIVLTMIMLCGLLGVQGMYQKAHGVGWAGQPLYWGDRICWIGLWDGANILSLLLITSVPFIIESLTGPWHKLSKILALTAGVYVMIGLFLANSRGGWLALGSVVVFYFYQRFGKRGLVLGGSCLVLLFAFGPSRLAETDVTQEKSARHRIDMWSEGLEMIQQNPVLGIGKGRFGEYTGKLIAHNTLLQNAGETGLLGAFLWLGVLYVSFKSVILVLNQGDRITPQLRSLSRAVLFSFIGYMVGSFFIVADLEILYILCAFSAIVLVLARRETGEPLPLVCGYRDLAAIAAILVCGVGLVYVLTASISAMS
jgi:O-antigen ligase